MIIVWLQSILILAVFFGVGLVIGHAFARKPVAQVQPRATAVPALVAPPQPAPQLAPIPRPVPVPFVADRRRAPLLYPVNQFGIVTVTRTLAAG